MAVNTLSAPELTAAWYARTQRWRSAWLTAIAMLASLASVVLVLATGIGSPVMLGVITVLILTFWRPRLGLYVAYTLVMLFENGSDDPLMIPGRYFNFGLQATFGLNGVIVSPLEMLLLATLLAWLTRGLIHGNLSYRGGPLGWPMVFFCVMLAVGVIRGRQGGGDMYIAFWELRPLIYTPICYVMAANLLRHRRDAIALAITCVLATGLYAIEGVYRKFALIDTEIIVGDLAYSHEMVIFVGTALLIVVAQQAVRTPIWQRVIGVIMTPFMVFTLLASQRRAGYIALLIGFIALALIFLFSNRKAFFLIAMPALIGVAVYLPVFWNDTGMLGQPARAVRSLYQPDPRDASSNMYRDLELINVRETIRANPVFGVGFGQQFYFIVPLPDLSFWAFWQYQPHHNILWVWLKTGAIGFIAFWLVMGTALARAAQVTRDMPSPELRTFGLMVVATIITTLVFCYVDLGLTMSRVMVFLGTNLGALAILDDIPGRPNGVQQREPYHASLRRHLYAKPA